jgi:hypothetical protein
MRELLGTEQGTYRVVTRNSSFTVDLDAMVVERHNPNVARGCDQSRFPLTEVVMVGWPMLLRVEANGKLHILRTSLVDVIAHVPSAGSALTVPTPPGDEAPCA